jgi:hypothetical protein
MIDELIWSCLKKKNIPILSLASYVLMVSKVGPYIWYQSQFQH